MNVTTILGTSIPWADVRAIGSFTPDGDATCWAVFVVNRDGEPYLSYPITQAEYKRAAAYAADSKR